MSTIAPTAIKPAPAPAPRREVMRFDLLGSGYYTEFVVSAEQRPYGRAAGYDSLPDAIRSLGGITRGPQRPAAGIFVQDGRYFAQPLRVFYDYDDKLGAYQGPWRLEQHPRDRDVFLGTELGAGEVTVDPALRMVVDGPVTLDTRRIPAPAQR